MVVAFVELDLELDAPEERRRGVEDKAISTWLETLGQACSAVGISGRFGEQLVAEKQLDGDADCRSPSGRIEHMG